MLNHFIDTINTSSTPLSSILAFTGSFIPFSLATLIVMFIFSRHTSDVLFSTTLPLRRSYRKLFTAMSSHTTGLQVSQTSSFGSALTQATYIEDQHCDCYIVDEHGERLVTLMDCVASKHWNIAVPTLPETNYDLLYQPLGLPEDTLPVRHNVQVMDHSFLDALLPFDEKVRGSKCSFLLVFISLPIPFSRMISRTV